MQQTARELHASQGVSREAMSMATEQAPYLPVRLYIENGSIVCRYYHAVGATAAIVWLGSVAGGFDSPAHDLFDRMALELRDQEVSSLRLRYRQPTDLDTSIEDALVGIEFLEQRGIRQVITVGFSLGGAVAIQAGAASPLVVGVVALASQSAGTTGANRISPRPLLLVHGANDSVMPVECSRLIYERALEPKELVIIPNAGHCFDETEADLHQLLRTWIAQRLHLAA